MKQRQAELGRFYNVRCERPNPDAANATPLFHGLGASVFDFCCRARVEPQSSEEEPNATHSIVLIRRGVFSRTDRERTIVADVNQILFFNKGERYRYAHPLPGGDDCTILALDEASARTATEGLAPPGTPDSDGPFPAGHSPSTPRSARLQHELLAVTSTSAAGSELAAQDVVAELIDEAMRALRSVMVGRPRDLTARSARRRDTVEGAKLILSRSIVTPPSLTELAAELDCSPFHLSRIFRAETGLALRHYLRRLRCLLAADRLRQGAIDLTSLALDLGFYDHSHFTNAFHREWGLPPSRVRDRTGTRQ